MLEVESEQIADLGLEALAELVAGEASEHMDELRKRAVDVSGVLQLTPNYGHEAAALLLREGTVALYSVNWDCAIERAGADCGMRIDVLIEQRDGPLATRRVALHKIHGCAERPSTLSLTQAEVDEPKLWAVARAQSELVSGMVVFIGLGTVGLYVREPLGLLVREWGDEATVRVADPNLSDDWRALLGENVSDVYLQRSADEFLDDLLRAVVRDALDLVEVDLQELTEHDHWAGTMQEGFARMREAFMRVPADGLLRWWRDRVADTEEGKPFVTEVFGRHSLMTVAQLIGRDGGLEVSGGRGAQTVASSASFFEIVCHPGQHIRRVQESAASEVFRRREERVYQDGRPVTVVVAGSIGTFPAPDAISEIADGEQDSTDIAEGVRATHIRVVSADDGIHGKLAA